MDQPPQLPQLFGIIPTGLLPILTPTSAPSPTSLIFTLPTTRPYNHIVVFLLPGITLPPNTGAAVYIQLPPSPHTAAHNGARAGAEGVAGQFKFLGAVGEGKESAVFRIRGLLPGGAGGNGGGLNMGEVDMDIPHSQSQLPSQSPSSSSFIPPLREITLGISIESAESISSQLALLQQSQSQAQAQSTSNSTSQALASTRQGERPDTLLLAQRIIRNAFNFLASFSGNTSGGVEVVPLKAFEEWWRKFEGRVRSDPGFLERDVD